MKKIPCLFKRKFENHKATLLKNVSEGCEWVLEGVGKATIKYDGSACAVIGGRLYARYDCKPSKKARKLHEKGDDWSLEDFNTPPANSVPCQEPDLVTGHYPHWVLVEDQPEYKYHREAFEGIEFKDGTYELMGEKINGNKSNLVGHALVRHGVDVVEIERTFEGIRQYLKSCNEEGVVFYNPDGRMCKIRKKDYGFDW